MTPEQLKWDKKQWAEYLGCSIQMYKRSYNFITSYYFVDIEHGCDQKYYVGLIGITYERNRYGQWRQCYAIQKKSTETFDKENSAVQYANEKFIPNLVFTPDMAKNLNVPAKILQTLHVNQR